MSQKLTPKQEAFCREYLIDLNATQAYQRVFKCKPTASEANACRLMANDGVMARIDELKQERSKRTEITADVILAELLKLATVDLGKAFDSSGTILPINEMPEEVRKAISSIEVNELFDGQGSDKTVIGFMKKIRFWDKPKSLELLGKHLKLFTEKHEHTVKLALEDLVAGSNDSSPKKD